ncbi:uncharacterized protein LOC141689268 [Apium graveolens]|uniref:uncharacterized protein LOC141689268 n=1 Tax=Apium graveolens TaxID=4045 RepID=UPI003D7BDCFE
MRMPTKILGKALQGRCQLSIESQKVLLIGGTHMEVVQLSFKHLLGVLLVCVHHLPAVNAIGVHLSYIAGMLEPDINGPYQMASYQRLTFLIVVNVVDLAALSFRLCGSYCTTWACKMK